MNLREAWSGCWRGSWQACLLLMRICLVLVLADAAAADPFRIEVVDQESGWPVPLVEFTTVHGVTFVSDNAGLIAFDLPELMERETWCSVRGFGYGVGKDGFGLELEAVRAGLCVWDRETEQFTERRELWQKSEEAAEPPLLLEGHPVAWPDDAGNAWLLFGNPFPTARCPARLEAWENPQTWERLESPEALRDEGGGRVVPHSGSIAWHPWRERWVAIFMEKFGKPSPFGELWYAEAASPLGPWGPAVKIVSHENYTFYNPRIHPEFSDAGSPALMFEATFTQQFADSPVPVPRYDDNQVLYRLDLDDARLTAANTTAP